MTRNFLRSVCRLLIGAVLTAQMAVAAYACPGLATLETAMPAPAVASAGGEHEAVADRAAAPRTVDCTDMMVAMDPTFANLCAEHCHKGQQSDHAATLTVPAATLTALYTTPLVSEPAALPRPAADATSALVAATPPLAILHCCFRT